MALPRALPCATALQGEDGKTQSFNAGLSNCTLDSQGGSDLKGGPMIQFGITPVASATFNTAQWSFRPGLGIGVQTNRTLIPPGCGNLQGLAFAEAFPATRQQGDSYSAINLTIGQVPACRDHISHLIGFIDNYIFNDC
jgi:hypothetical protein